MHENIEPEIDGTDKSVYCTTECPRHCGVNCDITGENETSCVPWYQNEIERLKAENKNYQSAQ